MLRLSLLNWTGALELAHTFAKTASKKIVTLIRSVPFSQSCFFFSINLLYGLAWNTDVMSRLVLVTALSYRNGYVRLLILSWVIVALAISLQSMAHRRYGANWSLFYAYFFGRCSSELDELVPLPHSGGRSLRYSNRFLSSFGSY